MKNKTFYIIAASVAVLIIIAAAIIIIHGKLKINEARQNCKSSNICEVANFNEEEKVCHINKFVCDDNNMCTTDSCDLNEGCIFLIKDCDDNNTCTEDDCEPNIGCVNRPYAGLLCQNKNKCIECKCIDGRPTNKGPIDCDDSDSCTNDYCDPDKGCIHENIQSVKCKKIKQKEECLKNKEEREKDIGKTISFESGLSATVIDVDSQKSNGYEYYNGNQRWVNAGICVSNNGGRDVYISSLSFNAYCGNRSMDHSYSTKGTYLRGDLAPGTYTCGWVTFESCSTDENWRLRLGDAEWSLPVKKSVCK